MTAGISPVAKEAAAVGLVGGRAAHVRRVRRAVTVVALGTNLILFDPCRTRRPGS
jgi:hypothetical protein